MSNTFIIIQQLHPLSTFRILINLHTWLTMAVHGDVWGMGEGERKPATTELVAINTHTTPRPNQQKKQSNQTIVYWLISFVLFYFFGRYSIKEKEKKIKWKYYNNNNKIIITITWIQWLEELFICLFVSDKKQKSKLPMVVGNQTGWHISMYLVLIKELIWMFQLVGFYLS